MDNLNTILAALAAAQQPAAQTPTARIQGPIIGLKSGAKIGDCRLRAVPAGVRWVKRAAKDGSAFVQSVTEYAAEAHIGPRGGAWADNAVDTGVPVAESPATTAFDLAGALASIDAAPAAQPAPAVAEPVI